MLVRQTEVDDVRKASAVKNKATLAGNDVKGIQFYENACIQVADDGTDYDYSVQQDYGSISNYSTLRTATR